MPCKSEEQCQVSSNIMICFSEMDAKKTLHSRKKVLIFSTDFLGNSIGRPPNNSWPAEGQPRPKVPILGGVYMFTKILRRARDFVAVEFSYYL